MKSIARKKLAGLMLSVALALAVVLAVFATQSAQAQTFTLLYSFTGGADGKGPYADLILDTAGNLYGTTVYGGDLNCNPPVGCGTVFKLDTAGNETVLHSFTGGADGGQPTAGLTMDGAGNLYGTTGSGGAGGGTVFKLSHSGSNWILSILYSFTGGNDGGDPVGKVILGLDGSLYGTTYSGGTWGAGTVFNLKPPVTACKSALCPWTETVLHSFTGGADGAVSYATLVQDAAGNLYGTTAVRGADNGGTVFKVDATGNLTVLYSFPWGGNGANPDAGVIRDAAGNLYGTTYNGGNDYCIRTRWGGHEACGVVFELDNTGQETVLLAFNKTVGAFPVAALIADPQGNLYGTTTSGGVVGCYADWGCGTVFEIYADGGVSVLYKFPSGGQSGVDPDAALVRDANGNLYGTAFEGGTNNAGTVFKLTP